MDNELIKKDLRLLDQIIDEVKQVDVVEFKEETRYLESLSTNAKSILQGKIEISGVFKMIQISSTIDFEAEILNDKILLLNQTTSKKTAINVLSSKLKSWAKFFSARLWQIICNLLTPVEWSIQGSLGNQSLLGLGGVQVQVKFGDNFNRNP